ncbi:hypothetical protein AALA00_09605 [Lachnospiraceae bacterium 46-15]
MATRHRIIVAGEISCSKSVDIRYEVRRALQKLGYNPFAYLIYAFVHQPFLKQDQVRGMR